MAEALRDSVAQYVFISSVAAYRNYLELVAGALRRPNTTKATASTIKLAPPSMESLSGSPPTAQPNKTATTGFAKA